MNLVKRIALSKISQLLFFIIVYYTINIILTPLTVNETVKFVLFNIFFVYSIGGLLFILLFKKNDFKISYLIFGYPLSIFAFILVFLLESYIEGNILIGLFLIILIWSFYKGKLKREKFKLTEGFPNFNVAILLLGVLLIINFLLFILPSLPPNGNSLSLIYQDSAWTVGNTWSLINFGFPLQDIRINGIKLGYHILQNIYQTICHRITGINPIKIHFYLEPLFDYLNLVFVIFCGSKYFLNLNHKAVLAFVVGFAFTGPLLFNGYTLHVFVNPLSMLFGLPFFCLLIFIILGEIKEDRRIPIFYLLICFINVVLTKAHLLLVFPLSYLLFVLYKIIAEREIKKRNLTIAILLLITSFILKNYFFYSTEGALNLRGLGSVNSLSSFDWGKIEVKSYCIKIVKYIVGELLFPLLVWWPALMGLLIILIERKNIALQKSNGIKSSIVFICSFLIVSLGTVAFIHFPGGDIYFLWYSYIICLVGFALICLNFNNSRLMNFFLVALIVISTINPIKSLNAWYNSGWGNFHQSRRIWDERATINKDEWQAMEWVNKNTPVHSVIITDRDRFKHELLGEEKSRFFLYSMISGRQFLNEGDEFIRGQKNRELVTVAKGYSNSLLNIGDKEIESGKKLVKGDYLVISKRFNKRYYNNQSKLKIVYNNRSVSIFEIIQN